MKRFFVYLRAFILITICCFFSMQINVYAQSWSTTDNAEFLTCAGSITSEDFEDLPDMAGSETTHEFGLSDLGNHFEVHSNDVRFMQTWNSTEYAVDGEKLLFFHSWTTTEENPAGITFSNFDGTNAEINTFGIYTKDWANGGQEGRMYAETNTGDTIEIISTDDIPELTGYHQMYVGIITASPFTSITLYTTTSGDWILFDQASYGINGVMGPHTIDHDFSSEVPFFPYICEGDAMGFPVDLDGTNNGLPSDPDETMVVIMAINGKIAGHMENSDRTLYYTCSNNSDCPVIDCTATSSCPSGKFVFRFVDMSYAGFDDTDASTWVYKTIRSVSLQSKNDGAPRSMAGVSPYSQAKAYKVPDNPIPANLIDINPSIDITGSGAYVSASFEDIDDGIGELYIQTDFMENQLNEIYFTSHPANTSLGTDVSVTKDNITITFEEVDAVGTTSIEEYETGPGLPGNFTICDPPVYYNITTTSEYTGTITICIEYDETCESGDLQLLHYEDDAWVNVTTSVDTDANLVCGEVSSLSPFTIGNRSGSIFKWTILHALMIAQYYVGLLADLPFICVADVNFDGQIDIVDALLVAQFCVRLITSFS